MFLGIDLEKFFSLNYLFNLHPQSLHPLQQRILIIVFSFLIISGLVIIGLAKKKKQPQKKGLKKIAYFCLGLGAIGFLFLFFRLGGIYFLSARFFLVIWLVIAVIWLVRIIKYFLKVYPKEKIEVEKKARIEKYLPH